VEQSYRGQIVFAIDLVSRSRRRKKFSVPHIAVSRRVKTNFSSDENATRTRRTRNSTNLRDSADRTRCQPISYVILTGQRTEAKPNIRKNLRADFLRPVRAPSPLPDRFRRVSKHTHKPRDIALCLPAVRIRETPDDGGESPDDGGDRW